MHSSSRIFEGTQAHYTSSPKSYGLHPFSRCSTGLNIVGSCCIRFHVAKSLTGFRLWATTPYNSKKNAIGRVCKRTQRVTSNNVGSCWPTVLSAFARGFRFSKSRRSISETFRYLFQSPSPRYNSFCVG